MNDRQKTGEPRTTLTKRQLRRFVAVVLCIFTVLYCLPVIVLRLPGFARWEMSALSVDFDYLFATPHIDADIIVVGESSALYGVDPEQMSKELGLKVVNLGNTLQSLPVIATLQLDRYFGQNKRPRLLVLNFVPWDLDFNHSTLARYEGDEMLFRRGAVSDVVHYGKQRPFELLTFPFQFYAVNTLFNPARRAWPPSRNGEIVQHLGHTPLITDKALTGACKFPQKLLNENGKMASVQSLVDRYRSSVDAVLVYVAPIPNCEGYTVFLSAPYRQLKTNAPDILPADTFGDDTYYAHPMPAGVPAVTERLIAAVRTALQGAGVQ